MSKAKVTKVRDGDTFETNIHKRAVRLANVDTPEKGKPGFAKAKQALTNMILGEEVNIDTVARDKYKRAVANVKYKGKSVNQAMKKYKK